MFRLRVFWVFLQSLPAREVLIEIILKGLTAEIDQNNL